MRRLAKMETELAKLRFQLEQQEAKTDELTEATKVLDDMPSADALAGQDDLYALESRVEKLETRQWQTCCGCNGKRVVRGRYTCDECDGTGLVVVERQAVLLG